MKIFSFLTGIVFTALLFTPGKIKYIDPANMDTSVRPGDNFYLYANGNWIKNNPVPVSSTRWGSLDVADQLTYQRLHGILEDAEHNKSSNHKTRMMADLYAAGMDSTAIESAGYLPVKEYLDRISRLTDAGSVLHEINYLRTEGIGNILFDLAIVPDKKNVSLYIPLIAQGGTAMPDRDYYLKDYTRSVHIRDAYRSCVQKMFLLTGEDETSAAASMQAVLKIESTLAQSQLNRVQLRDPNGTYHKFSVAGLSNLTPNINWAMVLSESSVNGADSLVVNNPDFLKTINDIFSSVPLNDFKSYLRWQVIHNAAPYLSSDFVNADFAFTQALNGQKEQTPRWKKMIVVIDLTLGDILGEQYVQKYFSVQAKEYMVNLMDNLQTTFGERIKKLDWMGDETKLKALEKLGAITKLIAYPDKWKTYEGLTITPGDFYKNLGLAKKWAYKMEVAKMGKPVDRREMRMTAPTVNASYYPFNNSITFPAGILHFPCFDFGADDAVNYGGIAGFMGHEFTHGFDDNGRQYDAKGNLHDWWTKDDADKFKERANKVVEQYNALTVLDTLHVNGRLTLGENLADLGGLTIAYEAFTKTKQFKEGKKIDGFTPQQRFFLSWAQLWRNNILPGAQAQRILTDPHAPQIYRVNAPITNIDAWYTAFNIRPGDKMYKAPAERIHIW